MEDCLELSDDQFKKLPTSQKLDVLYVNVRAIAGIRRFQKMQWVSIGGAFAAIGWLFMTIINHIGGK